MDDERVQRLVADGDYPAINALLRDGWITKRQVMEAAKIHGGVVVVTTNTTQQAPDGIDTHHHPGIEESVHIEPTRPDGDEQQ